MATPDVITRYQRSSDEQDFDMLVACFTEDATVVDESRTYQGRDEIRAWRDDVAAKYTFTSTVLDTKQTGNDTYQVTTLLRGDFPGGEATLTSVFTLTNGLISRLANA
jgi:ketosteroid isomerase-like protein